MRRKLFLAWLLAMSAEFVAAGAWLAWEASRGHAAIAVPALIALVAGAGCLALWRDVRSGAVEEVD